MGNEVMVWYEGKNCDWEGLYMITASDHANVMINESNGPKTFYTIQVKPYNKTMDTDTSSFIDNDNEDKDKSEENNVIHIQEEPQLWR